MIQTLTDISKRKGDIAKYAVLSAILNPKSPCQLLAAAEAVAISLTLAGALSITAALSLAVTLLSNATDFLGQSQL